MSNWLKRLFSTNRILEKDGYFYPQKWEVLDFSWHYVDKEDGYLWTNEIYGESHSKCSSLEEAKQALNKFEKQTPKKIYHYV